MKAPKKQSKKTSGGRLGNGFSKTASLKKKNQFEDEDDDMEFEDFEVLDDFDDFDDDDDDY